MKIMRAVVLGLLVSLAGVVQADTVNLRLGLGSHDLMFTFDDSAGATLAWDGGYYIGTLQAPDYFFDGTARLLITNSGGLGITQNSPSCGGIYPPCFLRGIGPQNSISATTDGRQANLLAEYLSEYLTLLSQVPNSGLIVNYNSQYWSGNPFWFDGSRTNDFSVVDVENVSPVPAPPAFILMLTGLGLLGAVRRTRATKAAHSSRSPA